MDSAASHLNTESLVMPITEQEALLRCIDHREIFHDEMLHLFRKIMSGEMSPVMIAALTVSYTHLRAHET